MKPLLTPVGIVAGFMAVSAPVHELAVYMEIVASLSFSTYANEGFVEGTQLEDGVGVGVGEVDAALLLPPQPVGARAANKLMRAICKYAARIWASLGFAIMSK